MNHTLTRSVAGGGSGQALGSAGGPSQSAAGEDEFRILVATRIRPFTRKEVREWRAEQQQNLAARQQQAVVARGQQRQPFGPGNEGLIDAREARGGVRAGPGSPMLADGFGAEDVLQAEPEPVMDVENDGTTVVLLDPQNPGMARGIYTYDYVFSSFAPSVDIMDMLDTDSGTPHDDRDGLDGTWAEMERSPRVNGHNATTTTTSVPVAFDDDVELTPEQEEQAEAEQRSIFNALALPLIDAAFQGLNVCIFAYGQTSSGKTYTMLGSKKHRGIMPRLCHELFRRVETGQFGGVVATTPSPPPAQSHKQTGTRGASSARGDLPVTSARSGRGGGGSGGGDSAKRSVRIEVSYMEIYNEQVRDLLKQRPKNAILHYNSRFDKKEVDHHEYQNLKVRHHPTNGTYVEGLTTVVVHSWKACSDLLRAGSQLRTQCSTEMNENSSRSHAIFQLIVTQSEDTGGKVRGKAVASTRTSKVNLVDLAGSERNSASQATGKHLAEANSINVSLSTLRRVIDGLVSRKKGQVIPYRESLLTYVLSDNFGGNCRTVMCANVSPSLANLAETESTLRYATMARAVRNRVKVNENPQARVIRELKDRMRTLQTELANAPTKELVDELAFDIHQGEEARRELEQREEALRRELAARHAQEASLKQALDDTSRRAEEWRREAARAHAEGEQLRELLQRLASSKPELLETSVGEEVLAATNTTAAAAALAADGRVDVGNAAAAPPKRKSVSGRTRRTSGVRAAGATEARRRSSAVATQSSQSAGGAGKKKKKKKKALARQDSAGGGPSPPPAEADAHEAETHAAGAASVPLPTHLADAYRRGQPPLSPSGRRRLSTSEPPSGRYPELSPTNANHPTRRLSQRAPNKTGAGTRLPPLSGNSRTSNADSSHRSAEDHTGASEDSAAATSEALEGGRAAAWNRQLAGMKASRLKKGTPLSLLGGSTDMRGPSSVQPAPASAPSKVEQTLFAPLDGEASHASAAALPVRASSSHVRVPDTYEAHVLLTRAAFSGVEDDNDLLWSTESGQLPSGRKRQASGDGTAQRLSVSELPQGGENDVSLPSVAGPPPPPCFASTRVRVSVDGGSFTTFSANQPRQGSHSPSLLSPDAVAVARQETSHRPHTNTSGSVGGVETDSSFYQTESYLGGRPSTIMEESVHQSAGAWSPSAGGGGMRRASVLPTHEGDPELSITGTAAVMPGAVTAHRTGAPSGSIAPHPPSANHSHASPQPRRTSASYSSAVSMSSSGRISSGWHRRSSPVAVPQLSQDALVQAPAAEANEILLSPTNGENSPDRVSGALRTQNDKSIAGSHEATAPKTKSTSVINGTATTAGAQKPKKKKRAPPVPARSDV